MKKIKVLLCDDHNIVRAGMKCLLETAGDIEVVGEAANGHECVRETERLRPDVVIMDLAMPLLNGMEAARQILKQTEGTKVLVVSSYCDDEHVLGVIEAGMGGYLLKKSAGTELLQAIREIYQGNVFLSPSLVKHLFRPAGATAGEPTVGGRDRRLSRRETEVLQLMAESYSTKQIAGVLSLSSKTVEKHRTSLMQKLRIQGIAALTRYAASIGIIEVPRGGVPMVLAC